MKPFAQELLHKALELKVVCAHSSLGIGSGMQSFVFCIYVVVITQNLNLLGLGWTCSCVSRLVSSENPVVSLRRP